MKNLFLIAVFLISSISFDTDWFELFQADVFVDAVNGSDSNSGTWFYPVQTIAEANTIVADGERIGLKAGQYWNESATVPISNITYKKYGRGANPKIYGSEVITGWTKRKLAENIYVTHFTTDVNQLFIDDERMQLARYPKDNDWNYEITTVNSTTQFISTYVATETDDYYNNATIIARDNDWTVKQSTITDYTAATKTFTIAAPLTYDITVGYGFFLCNKLEFLTQAGDWYYNTATDSLYFWTPNGDDPDNYIVRASTLNNCIYASGKDNVTVKDLEFLQAKNNGIELTTCNDWVITNNNFSDFDNTAINLGTAIDNIEVSGNVISNVNHDGIYSVADNSTFTDNTLTNIALIKNFGTSGMENPAYSNAGRGIVSRGDDNIISYNRFVNVGFNAIRYGGINHTIENNYIDSVCLTVDDGGGIYCFNSGLVSAPGVAGSVVRRNILTNVIGNINGRPVSTGYKAYPIYLDNRVHDVTIEYNSIYNSGGHAIVQNPECGANNIVRYNTILSANIGLYANGSNDVGTFYTKYNSVYVLDQNYINNANQCVVGYRYGRTLNSDSNIYVSHYNADVFRNFTDGTNAIVYEDLATWRTNTTQDANSTIDVSTLPANHTERMLYNNTKSLAVWYVNNATSIKEAFTGDDITGDTIQVQPFASKVITGLDLIYISETQAETIAPVVTAFTIEETSGGLVDILSFTTTGSPTKYLLTTSATTPSRSEAWTDTIPELYFTSTEGALTLYAWCMDAAGNISSSANDNTTVSALATIGITTIGGLTTTTGGTLRANSYTMSEDGWLTSMYVYHTTSTNSVSLGIYSDNSASPNALIASTGSVEITDVTEWQKIDLITPVFVASGTVIWLAYNKSGTSGNFYVDNATGLPRAYKTLTYGTGVLSDPFGTPTLDTGGSYSIYAKYVK